MKKTWHHFLSFIDDRPPVRCAGTALRTVPIQHVQTAGEQVTSQHLPCEVWSTSAICAGSTRGTLMVVLVLIVLPSRVLLDSWVVSQIWLDSDSNESSQSWVSYENQGYESSQSWVTLIVIWVRVKSTGYCLSQSCITDFPEEKTLRFGIYL